MAIGGLVGVEIFRHSAEFVVGHGHRALEVGDRTSQIDPGAAELAQFRLDLLAGQGAAAATNPHGDAALDQGLLDGDQLGVGADEHRLV